VFQIPSTLPTGTYFVDVAIFSGNWSTLYVYGWHKATFTVN
jgi:hypothetical protein